MILATGHASFGHWTNGRLNMHRQHEFDLQHRAFFFFLHQLHIDTKPSAQFRVFWYVPLRVRNESSCEFPRNTRILITFVLFPEEKNTPFDGIEFGFQCVEHTFYVSLLQMLDKMHETADDSTAPLSCWKLVEFTRWNRMSINIHWRQMHTRFNNNTRERSKTKWQVIVHSMSFQFDRAFDRPFEWFATSAHVNPVRERPTNEQNFHKNSKRMPLFHRIVFLSLTFGPHYVFVFRNAVLRIPIYAG